MSPRMTRWCGCSQLSLKDGEEEEEEIESWPSCSSIWSEFFACKIIWKRIQAYRYKELGFIVSGNSTLMNTYL